MSRFLKFKLMKSNLYFFSYEFNFVWFVSVIKSVSPFTGWLSCVVKVKRQISAPQGRDQGVMQGQTAWTPGSHGPVFSYSNRGKGDNIRPSSMWWFPCGQWDCTHPISCYSRRTPHHSGGVWNTESWGHWCRQLCRMQVCTSSPEQGEIFPFKATSPAQAGRAFCLPVRRWSGPKMTRKQQCRGCAAMHDCLSCSPRLPAAHSC